MDFLIKNCFKIISIVLLFIGVNSCKKTAEISNSVQINPLDTITNFSGLIVPRNGEITFSLNYFYENEPIIFDSKNYTNAAADTFTQQPQPEPPGDGRRGDEARVGAAGGDEPADAVDHGVGGVEVADLPAGRQVHVDDAADGAGGAEHRIDVDTHLALDDCVGA